MKVEATSAAAEILTERGVPFVLVTGYDADSVDPRFAGIPILQKPIERDALQKIFIRRMHRSPAAGQSRSAARA